MTPSSPALAAAVGYLAGMLPSAELVATAMADIDVRAEGSGNPGAANVATLLGRRAGAAVFGLDMGKAVVAATVGRRLAGPGGAHIAATASVLGHCYPALRGFRGGKGVATSFGQMLATFPAYLPVDLALGAVAAKSDFWKKRPVATIGATCGLWVGLGAVWSRRGLPNLWAGPADRTLPLAAAASSIAIVHRFAAEHRAATATDTGDRARDGAPDRTPVGQNWEAPLG